MNFFSLSFFRPAPTPATPPQSLLERSRASAIRRLDHLRQVDASLESSLAKLIEDIRQTKLCIAAEEAKLSALGVEEARNDNHE